MNFQVINIGGVRSENFVRRHIDAPGVYDPRFIEEVTGDDITAVREGIPGSGGRMFRRVIRLGEGVRMGEFNPAEPTILMVVANRAQWASDAPRSVERLGRPDAPYGCVVMLPPGAQWKVERGYSQYDEYLPRNWSGGFPVCLGSAYRKGVLVSHNPLPVPWVIDQAKARECAAFADALGVGQLAAVLRCTPEEIRQQSEFLNGGGGTVVERASHGVKGTSGHGIGGSTIGWVRSLPPETEWVLLRGGRLDRFGLWEEYQYLMVLNGLTPEQVGTAATTLV
jgi:hypothetical protein